MGLVIPRGQEDPYEQSVFLLACMPYLQPFIDVNKRVGRLAANIPLLKANLPEDARAWLSQRVAEIVPSLHEGNSIAWGVNRDLWQRYVAHHQEQWAPAAMSALDVRGTMAPKKSLDQ